MSKAKKREKENSSATMIGLLFIVSSVVFGFYVLSEDHLVIPEEGQADFSSLHKLSDMDKVNDHLKTVTDRIEIDRMKTMVENLKASREGRLKNAQVVDPSTQGPVIDFGDEQRDLQLAQELGRTNTSKKQENTARSQAYEAVIQRRAIDQANAIKRREEAQEFVAKARKDGWVVRLNANYEIVSYHKLEGAPPPKEDVEFKGFTVVPK